ncbi:hypothetical protein [Planktotalea sp.]|uniref:hypothetical protein n=1 Tax=Planktotalea sp. TaxID=2029877 RepID=UPI003D6B4DE9
MPHAELKYSSTLNLDAARILARIEQIIQSHDAGSGECKGRAYPCEVTHHNHVLIEIGLLPKAHRDETFMKALLNDLKRSLVPLMPDDVFFSLSLTFSSTHYVTGPIGEMRDA